MLLLILSWIYILITTVHLGYGTARFLKLNTNNFVLTAILGLFSATILGTIWACFGRINSEFHLFLLVVNFLFFWIYKKDIKTIYNCFWLELIDLNSSLKLYLKGISILIIAQCAAKPFIIDNESYYIQTIKWINEYGLVKGLANLHIFFGQTSGWHITQSIFNFSFLYSNFNDLSGYCLLLGSVFAIFRLDSYFEKSEKIDLIIGLLPIANVLLFQFISAPSPDLPVYIFSFILFYYFITDFKAPSSSSFTIQVLLTLFILFIKPTAVALLLIPFLFLIANFKILKNKLVPSILISLLVFALFIIKNTIITGYPLFPTRLISVNSFDFKVPNELIAFYFDETKLYGFYSSQNEFHAMSWFQLIIKWLTINKINALFNVTSILMVLFSSLFIYKFQNKRSYWLLYLVMVLQFGLLLFTSPQFRFFIHFLLFFGFLLLSSFINSKRYVLFFLFGSGILVLIMVLVPLNFSVFTTNKLLSENSTFKLNEIIFPHSNTKKQNQFYKAKIGNLEFNSPLDNSFFWGTGDGAVPCVNTKQLEYFKNQFHYIPQLRTNHLKEGFYSKKILQNE
ncbi:MAG: hypothetical protein RIQ59_931 [Bacteroidota bacterium]|jgi:hypothetical protein